jgi:sulfur-carrier protein
MIRVVLPQHLRTLAGTGREVTVEVAIPVTLGAVIDVIERQYPMLGGTIRDYGTLKRRPLVRFFACGEDVSQEGWEYRLPEAVVMGKEAFHIIGAIAGG